MGHLRPSNYQGGSATPLSAGNWIKALLSKALPTRARPSFSHGQSVPSRSLQSTVSVIPVKSPMAFFTELERKISQFIWKHKRPWIVKAVLRKKTGAGGIHLPDFRLSYKATVIKTVRDWHQNRNMDRWNKIESPITHTPVGTLLATKETRIYNGAKSLCIKCCWENWTVACKRTKLEHFQTPYTKINSKMT